MLATALALGMGGLRPDNISAGLRNPAMLLAGNIGVTTIGSGGLTDAAELLAASGGMTNPGTGGLSDTAETLAATGGVFGPSSIAGLSVYFDGDLGVTASGTISAWADQSGNANNASQATSGSRPTYTASDSDFNGHGSISSDGTKFMTTAAFAGGTVAAPITIYLVYKCTSVPSGAWLCDNDVSGGRTGITTSGNNIQGYSGSFLTSSTSIITTGILCFVAGSSGAMYLNNSSSAIVSGNAGTDGLGSMTLLSPAGGGTGIVGKLAAVLVYSGAHTLTNRQNMFQWAALKYGLSAS